MRPLRSYSNLFLIGLTVLLVLDCALRPALVGETAEAKRAFQQTEFTSLFVPDAYAVLRPNLKVECAAYSKTFPVETNSHGMRMGEISLEKKPGVRRVAVMGGSLAFGWGLPVDEVFPAKLEAALNQDGKKTYEVLNFAAPGFTAFQAVKQYEQTVQSCKPEILILAFGLYDSYESRLSEEELYGIQEKLGLIGKKKGLTGFINSYSTLGHIMAQRNRRKTEQVIQTTIDERVRENVWKKKVPADAFKKYLSSILESQKKQGGKIILVNDNLFNFDAIGALQELSEQYKVPLLDIRAIFDGLGGYEELKTHFMHNLQKAGVDYFENDSESNYLFRAQSDDNRTSPKGLFITGNLPELGDGVPNTVRMYDDGSHGDERAGDKVWSLQLTLPAPKQAQFTFTDTGIQGQWGEKETGFEHTSFNRQFMYHYTPVGSERDIHWCSPVYKVNRPSFSYLLIHPDSPLPNAEGHTTIAHRLAKLVRDAAGTADDKKSNK